MEVRAEQPEVPPEIVRSSASPSATKHEAKSEDESKLESSPTESNSDKPPTNSTESSSGDCSGEAISTRDDKNDELSTETNSAQCSDSTCYRYEGDVCVYTDRASGTEYLFCTEEQRWKPRTGENGSSCGDTSGLANCFYIGEQYCYRDETGALFRLATDTNTWELWSEKEGETPIPPARDTPSSSTPDVEDPPSSTLTSGDPPTSYSTAAPGDPSVSSTPAPGDPSSSSAPGAVDRNYFRDGSGRWCYRSGSDIFRWQEPTGWILAAPPGPPGKRPRRPNRGSSDESEHDSDEEEEMESVGKKARAEEGSEHHQREGATMDSDNISYPRISTAAYVNEDGVSVYTDPSDGAKYEWDPIKSAWFPQIDEEFLALHSLNYGFDAEGRPVEAPPILPSSAPPTESALPTLSSLALPTDFATPIELAPPTNSGTANSARQMKTKKQPEWFEVDQTKNTKVYVTGLDESTTESEFVELMSKCGLVMKDTASGKWKVKLYEDDYGVRKGDALCTYIKVESVELAERILDGSKFKNRTISVQPAQFSMRGQFDPKLKPKKRQLKRKDRERLQKKQERLFAWQPDRVRGERERHERVMVLKNAFDPGEFDQSPQLMLEYRQDVSDECAKYGLVKKVVVHDRHADGVVEVVFSEAAEADACIAVMNGRWFAGRKISASTWDGRTKYRVEETEEERRKRLENWDKFVEGEDKDKGAVETKS